MFILGSPILMYGISISHLQTSVIHNHMFMSTQDAKGCLLEQETFSKLSTYNLQYLREGRTATT